MADFTPNYNLKKPLRTEYYNVADANGNSDIVDTQLKAVNDRVGLVEGDVDALELGKVDKVTGKGLSTNDYTTTEKNKLAGIPVDTAAQLADKVNSVNGVLPDANGNVEIEAGGIPAQEAWQTLTLLNGITGTLKIMKDSFGFVHLEGEVFKDVWTAGLSITTIPIGYRPEDVKHFLSPANYGSTAIRAFLIAASGNVVNYGTVGQRGYINIAYKAGA